MGEALYPAKSGSPESSTELPPAILLMGPTASGKTGVALDLARRLPVEIISAPIPACRSGTT